MPIHEQDPWRRQYFEHVDCPAGVFIPTDDADAYRWNPRHRWICNKLLVAESQGIECAPHGIEPSHYPVFSKPIYNLRGMGVGSRTLKNEGDYRRHCTAGHLWMSLLTGEHVSSDFAVVRGEAKWWRHAAALSAGAGTFDYWIIETRSRPELEEYCRGWIRRNLPGYTGMLNLETIDGRIIEGHLRFTDQWPDLYGEGWLDALVGLYAGGTWNFADRDRRLGYSVVLFGPHDRSYRQPSKNLLERLRRRAEVSSIQITFDETRSASSHAMPPGGFRLAVINSRDLVASLDVRMDLRRYFALEPVLEGV